MNNETDIEATYNKLKHFYDIIAGILNTIKKETITDNGADAREKTKENSGQKYLPTLLQTIENSTKLLIIPYNPGADPKVYDVFCKDCLAYNLWLIGQLFYMSTLDETACYYEQLINTQISILHQMFNCQQEDYDVIITEYTEVLQHLCVFTKHEIGGKENPLLLTPFVPPDNSLNIKRTPVEVNITGTEQCNALQANVLKIIEFSLMNDFKTAIVTDCTVRNLNNALFLILHGSTFVKFTVLEILCSLVKKFDFTEKRYSLNVLRPIHKLVFVQEQLFYEYAKKDRSAVEQFRLYESFCASFMEELHAQPKFAQQFERMSSFIVTQSLRENDSFHSVNRSLLDTGVNVLERTTRDKIESFTEYVSYTKVFLKTQNDALLPLLEAKIMKEVLKYVESSSEVSKENLFAFSTIWMEIHDFLTSLTDANKGSFNALLLFVNSLLQMAVRLKLSVIKRLSEGSDENCENVFLLEGNKFLRCLFRLISKSHIENEPFNVNFIIATLSHVAVIGYVCEEDCEMILQSISYPICKALTKNYLDDTVKSFYQILRYEVINVDHVLENLRTIMQFSLLFPNSSLKKQFPDIFKNIFKTYKQFDSAAKCEFIKCLPYFLIYLTTQTQKHLLLSILPSLLEIFGNETMNDVNLAISETLPFLVCLVSNPCKCLIVWDTQKATLRFEFVCLQCTNLTDCQTKFVKGSEQHLISSYTHACEDLDVSVVERAAKNVFCKNVKDDTFRLRLASNLLVYYKHLPGFRIPEFASNWLAFLQDDCTEVRIAFCNVIFEVLRNTQQDQKADILDVTVTKLRQALKCSLRFRKYDLQETLLSTCEKIGTLNDESVILPVTTLLIQMIMIPITGSDISYLAVDSLMHISKSHGITPNLIYVQYKRDIFKTVAQLCVFNFRVFHLNLENSIEALSLAFELSSLDEMVVKGCQYFLPFFVPYVVRDPTVSPLIEEFAQMNEVNVYRLLADTYTIIFKHVLLYETDIVNETMDYLQKMTGYQLSVFKKRMLTQQALLDELLINFHDRTEQVISTLKLIAVDDPDSCSNAQINEYIQPRFLGVLLCFDAKLVSVASTDSLKKKIIQSLSGIVRFMGSKYITPVRFKVVATLRTALRLTHSDFPKLNCEAWNSFVHSCDIESLGPKLASIFISLLVLVDAFPRHIAEIFEYLVVDNRNILQEHIPDLFFIANVPNVPDRIKQVIQMHIDELELNTFSKKLEWHLKHLEHETVELRIRGMEFTKTLLEENRDDLDRMVLGYNGIDPLIVRLLDILTATCREKDAKLRLACGECMGALGAVEPSHFPRQSAESAQIFTYFMDDDVFIYNALIELMRALQVNTTNVDRFLFAIQEILKVFQISPDASSARNHLWKKFTEAQTEIMFPLLKSRYGIGIDISVTVCPVYKSNLGATYSSWVHNWTAKLIMFLEPDRKCLMEKCYPSLKQEDEKTVSVFLPYILLHALLEGTAEQVNSIKAEFQAIVSSPDKVQTLGSADVANISVGAVRVNSLETSDADVRTTQALCIKTAFVLLDFLNRWTTEWKWDVSKKQTDKEYTIVVQFLDSFSQLELARCNYFCGEYLRALVHLERHLATHPEDQNKYLSFLSEIYAQLNEPDAVYGIAALQQTEPSLEQRILVYEITGKMADAAACYETMPAPLKLCHIMGLIKCYIDLDNVNSALNFAKGAFDNHPEYKQVLWEEQAEPLWRLGHFDELNQLLNVPELEESTNWGVLIGRAFSHFRENSVEDFNSALQLLVKQQVELFGGASLEHGLYQDGYSYVARLHALKELQEIQRVTDRIMRNGADVNGEIRRLTSEWELRLKMVQDSIRIMEPILCLRRVGLLQAKHLLKYNERACDLLNSALGNLWLKSANLARDAGMPQQAYTYTLSAEEYNPANLFLEKAKLYWMKEEHEMAFTTLNRGVEKFLLKESVAENKTSGSSNSQKWSHLSPENRKICAEAKLLIAKYNDSTSNVEAEVNLGYYKDAVDVLGECEKSLVCLAQYYDRVYANISDEERETLGSDIQVYMINFFGKSLQYGTEYVYQSMPRLLSIWFDYGTRAMENAASHVKQTRRESLLKMTKLIDTFLSRLPPYIFLSAFSQIVSRICHPNTEVHQQLKKIIIKLIQHYPQQTMWMMVSVLKSSYTVRSKRCAEILNDPQLKSSTSMNRFITDFTLLADKLIDLCNKPISDNVQTTSVASLVRSLPKLLADKKFSDIIMPVEKYRKLVLPNPDLKSSQHNPFQNQYVYIMGIDDQVSVLPSLQKPRKISLRGSDGKKYIHMLKPKDDLRRDFRLMEFNMVVNHLLMRDGECRQRRLCIRTYSVAPLNEECGLIEWVDNLVGLRPILMAIYKHGGMHTHVRELKAMVCQNKDPLTLKRDAFLNKLLPRHPPVLGTWFQKTFPDVQGWLSARTAYTRTTAVMSMVGYMLGLGDRHGENILFDSTNGDTVHVDFNCLFNKGEQFDWPERVPFRLTHNMVSAMGPLGVEGVFRKSCVVTLKVLRSHRDTLMSIVTPFVYDPLVSWTRNPTARRDANNSEMTNEQAVEHVQNIKLRLQGFGYKRSKTISIPLSVEGQANNLILEATSIDNLCRMYIGWGAFM